MPNDQPARQLVWNFSVESYRALVNRTKLSGNEKAFLSALIALSYATDQKQDGQTYSGSIFTIGEHPYFRRSGNTARRVKKQLIACGLVVVIEAPGKSDVYCINWDKILDLPTLEDPEERPPQSTVGPLEFVSATPPTLGGHPSQMGGVPLPNWEGTPPKAGGVVGGVPPKTLGNGAGTPPKTVGVTSDMSLSVIKSKRQRHVPGWWPRNITKRDLQQPRFVNELWLLAVQNSWLVPTPENRQRFFAHASRCTQADNPGGAFTSNVMAKRLFYRDEDALWAERAIDAIERHDQPFTGENVVKQAGTREQMTADLLAWQAQRELAKGAPH